ncbi:MAG: hypothetical protein NVS4B3_23670 [Gemmatimonadaceae bacterium]
MNANGTPRIARLDRYEFFWRTVVPKIREWSSDPLVDLSPSYVAAVVSKESAFDSLAISDYPAYGLAQLVATDDDYFASALRQPRVAWIGREATRWTRHPMIHDRRTTASRARQLLAHGQVTARNEYLFDPLACTRAGMLLLRVLADVWTHADSPERYGRLARSRLSAGDTLREDDLLDLVTVSYNQGEDFTAKLVRRYGKSWPRHLAENGRAGVEASDYLDRVRTYTALYQGVADEKRATPTPRYHEGSVGVRRTRP